MNVFVLIIFLASLLVILGCTDSENVTKIKNLDYRISNLRSQQSLLEQELNTAIEKQGWFRKILLPDAAKVNDLRMKIKKIESEINTLSTKKEQSLHKIATCEQREYWVSWIHLSKDEGIG